MRTVHTIDFPLVTLPHAPQVPIMSPMSGQEDYRIIVFVVLVFIFGALSRLLVRGTRIPYSIVMFIIGFGYGIIGMCALFSRKLGVWCVCVHLFYLYSLLIRFGYINQSP